MAEIKNKRASELPVQQPVVIVHQGKDQAEQQHDNKRQSAAQSCCLQGELQDELGRGWEPSFFLVGKEGCMLEV